MTTKKRTYATRAEAEADTSFRADPAGAIMVMLFALAFAVGALMLGFALAGCSTDKGSDPSQGAQSSAALDCGYHGRHELRFVKMDTYPNLGPAWVFEDGTGHQVYVANEPPYTVDCNGRG